MSTPIAHRLLAAGVGALTAGALVAGCSSSNKAATSTAPTTAATSSTSSGAGASAGPSMSSDGGGSAATGSAVPSAAAKTFAAGSGKGSKFCNELGVIAAQQAKLGPGGDTPADTKKTFDEIKSLKGTLVGSAPSSIKGDLTTLFDYITQIDGVLAKAGYDWTKINPADLASFEADAQKFETASQNVDNYVTQACGIDTGGGSSPSN